MRRQIIPFTTEEDWLIERTKDVTSTDVAALFGESPYSTPFELFHNKRDQTLVRLEGNERMEWGIVLQDAIAGKIAADNGWKLRKMDEYIRLVDERLGSSFDYEVELPDGRKAPLEIKNVDSMIFYREWKRVGTGQYEAPVHIEAQVQQQTLVGGYELAYLGALVGGNRLILIQREAVPSIHQAILERTAKLWYDIENDNVPSPDWVEDAEFIMSLFKRTAPGKVYDASLDQELRELAFQLEARVKETSEGERQKDALKAQIVSRIQDAVRAQGPDYHITATPTKNGRDVRVYIKEQVT